MFRIDFVSFLEGGRGDEVRPPQKQGPESTKSSIAPSLLELGLADHVSCESHGARIVPRSSF